MSCKLTTDVTFADCTNLEAGGTTGLAYGIDIEDFRTATVTREPDGTITNIVLTTPGAKAVKYDLPNGATVPTSPLTVNNGGKSGFAHSVGMFVPTKDQATKKEIAGYANFGAMVWVVILDASVVANTYGSDVGLTLTAYDEIASDPSKGGGLDTVWSTPADKTFESLPPVTTLSTDRAGTIAMLELLLVAVP